MRQAQPPYRVVSAALRERIDSGEWLPGEQIPSVRKIADEYGVSMATARRAVVVLREADLILALIATIVTTLLLWHASRIALGRWQRPSGGISASSARTASNSFSPGTESC